nr:17.8 kDa protein [Autographa californica nucleopolyhedrovirus]
MATKRKIGDGYSSSDDNQPKRERSEGGEDQQLVPYNSGAFNVKHDETGVMCYFTPSSIQLEPHELTKMLWQEQMAINVKRGNFSILNCSCFEGRFLKNEFCRLSNLNSLHEWKTSCIPSPIKISWCWSRPTARLRTPSVQECRASPADFGFPTLEP